MAGPRLIEQAASRTAERLARVGRAPKRWSSEIVIEKRVLALIYRAQKEQAGGGK